MKTLREIEAIVHRMAVAEASYGCGFYGEKDWMAAYDELLDAFGFGKQWAETVGEALHTERWQQKV